MRSVVRGRGTFAAKLALICLLALSLLPLGCDQGGPVEGDVRYKYVTGMQDRRYYIIALNEPSDGQPSIVVDEEAPEAVRERFPAAGNLVVDDATLQQINRFYDPDRVKYLVVLHLTSGSHYYEQAYRTDREIFNELQMGESVKLDTEASDIGPKITAIRE